MNKHVSVLVGVLILVGALVYVRVLGVRSDFEYVILRTFMALAGAYAAAGLLGAIEVQSKVVKAGGGLGVAVLLFVVNPVGSFAVAAAPPEKKEQITSVDSLLRVQDPEKEEQVESAVDSLSRALGYKDYSQLRVLGSTKNATALRQRAMAYRVRIGK